MADMNVSVVVRWVDQLKAGAERSKTVLNGFRDTVNDNVVQPFRAGAGDLFNPARIEDNIRRSEARIRDARSRLLGAWGQAVTLAAPVLLAANFDQSFKSVEKVFEGPEHRLTQLRKFALETSMMVPIAARDLNELMAQALQGGVPTEDVEAFTYFVSRMAVAADMTGAAIGKTFAEIRNTYQLNQEGIEALGDSANFLSNKMATTAENLFAFTNRASGAAGMLKLTAVEMNAIGATLTASGIVPETAARGFNAFATRVVNGGKKVDAAFASIGMSRKDLLADFRERGAIAFAEFIDQLATSGDTGIAALTDIVGLDFSDDFAKLVNNPDLLRQALGLVGDPSLFKNSALDEAAKQSEGAAAQFRRLRNQATAIAIVIGEKLLPPILDLTQKAGELAMAFMEWAEANPELVSWLVQAAAAVLAFSIATKLLAFGWALTGGAILKAIPWLMRTGRLLRVLGRGGRLAARALGAIMPVKWAALIRPIPWVRLAGRLTAGIWGRLVMPLVWTATMIPTIGWRKLAGRLSWGLLIRRFSWRALMVIPKIGWAILAGYLLWEKLIKPLVWDHFLDWGGFERLVAEMEARLNGLVDKLREFMGMEPQVRPGDEGYVELPEHVKRRAARVGKTRAGVTDGTNEAQEEAAGPMAPAPPASPSDKVEVDGSSIMDSAAALDRTADRWGSVIERAGSRSGQDLGSTAMRLLTSQAPAIGSAIGRAAAEEIRKSSVNVQMRMTQSERKAARHGKARAGAALADGVDD